MNQAMQFLTLAACVMTLASCGAYIGSPPKQTVVKENTTTTPPSEVRIYTP